MRITDTIAIPDDELTETFIRASGPGGQNVNKVATAVQLRWHATASAALPAAALRRLIGIAGRKATAAGEIIITADRFRSQEQNREDARARLRDMVKAALHKPKFRVPTKPSKGAKRRRLDGKKKRGAVKALRREPS
jgi:ribosome-associated protein